MIRTTPHSLFTRLPTQATYLLEYRDTACLTEYYYRTLSDRPAKKVHWPTTTFIPLSSSPRTISCRDNNIGGDSVHYIPITG